MKHDSGGTLCIGRNDCRLFCKTFARKKVSGTHKQADFMGERSKSHKIQYLNEKLNVSAISKMSSTMSIIIILILSNYLEYFY
jgi:hypothetical protein